MTTTMTDREDEILSCECTAEEEVLAATFVESFPTTTAALFAIQMHLLCSFDDDEGAALVAELVRKMAKHEAGSM
jgi:hypothetical protein